MAKLIQAYNRNWSDDFNTLKILLNEALINLDVSIEHVGSTSVPGLAAKPIIDIDVIFRDNTTFDEIKMRLEKAGYYHNGNQGIPGREVFKRKENELKNEVLDSIVHHLYVCPSDSEEFKKHLLFRDYLIAHEEARVQYQLLKYQIAMEANQDKKKYAELKEVRAAGFISDILSNLLDKYSGLDS